MRSWKTGVRPYKAALNRHDAAIILAAVLLALMLLPLGGGRARAADVETARPSVNGFLHVEGTQLVDEAGAPYSSAASAPMG